MMSESISITAAQGRFRSRIRAFLARHRLRASVVLLCVLSVATLWGGLLLQFDVERERIIESKREQNENLAKMFGAHVTRTMRAAEILSRDMGAEYQRYGRSLDLAHYARDRAIESDPYNLLTVADESGNVVLASVPLGKPLNISAASNYRHHRDSGAPGLFISEPRVGAATGKWGLYLSTRWDKPDGSFGGIAVVSMDPFYFTRIYDDLQLGPDAIVVLIGLDGVVRARRAGIQPTAGLNLFSTPLFTQRLPRAAHGSYVGISPVDKVNRIYSYRSVKDYPLVVVVGTSIAVALAGHDRDRMHYLQAAVAVTAVIVCLGLFALMQIVRSQREAEERRRSEGMFRVLAEGSPVGIFRVNAEGECKYVNDRWCDISGMRPEAAMGNGWLSAIHPEDRERVRSEWAVAASGRRPFYSKFRFKRPDGTVAWLIGKGRPETDVDTDMAAPSPTYTGTITDITELKRIEERLRVSLGEKETLLREIHHRVKNNLQIISSLLHFQSRKARDADDVAVFQEGRDRLKSMILVHERLYQSPNLSRIEFGEYARNLVAEIGASYSDSTNRIDLVVDAAAVYLPIEVALPLGMLLSELLTNAYKYAFPDGRRGTLRVAIEGAEGNLHVEVTDDGVGLPGGVDPCVPASFGMQLVANLAARLSGEVRYKGGAGVRVDIVVPMQTENLEGEVCAA